MDIDKFPVEPENSQVTAVISESDVMLHTIVTSVLAVGFVGLVIVICGAAEIVITKH